jgi:hypothetical protein
MSSVPSLFSALVAAVTIALTLLFLPALVELRKPKDSGPRLITKDISRLMLISLHPHLLNIEDEQLRAFDSQLAAKIASLLGSISNLES